MKFNKTLIAGAAILVSLALLETYGGDLMSALKLNDADMSINIRRNTKQPTEPEQITKKRGSALFGKKKNKNKN